MAFHTVNKHYPKLNINGNNIERATNFNFLGFTLSSTLSWYHHINKISLKISKSIGILYHLRDIYPRAALQNLCKGLRVLKVFDMFNVAIWKFYDKLMHHDLPEYFPTTKPTLPTVCRRYEIRASVFHLLVIRHTFAEHSIWFCLINLLNKDTRFTMIMGRVKTDPYPSFKFYMKEQIFDSFQKKCINHYELSRLSPT